jgi:hypothetical protein
MRDAEPLGELLAEAPLGPQALGIGGVPELGRRRIVPVHVEDALLVGREPRRLGPASSSFAKIARRRATSAAVSSLISWSSAIGPR